MPTTNAKRRQSEVEVLNARLWKTHGIVVPFKPTNGASNTGRSNHGLTGTMGEPVNRAAVGTSVPAYLATP